VVAGLRWSPAVKVKSYSRRGRRGVRRGQRRRVEGTRAHQEVVMAAAAGSVPASWLRSGRPARTRGLEEENGTWARARGRRKWGAGEKFDEGVPTAF
jgi:hypothetical protein